MRESRTWRECALLSALLAGFAAGSMPLPFTRELEYMTGTSLESGKDVFVLQSLLNRSPATLTPVDADGEYGAASASAVATFQEASALAATGVFDNVTGAPRCLQLSCLHVLVSNCPVQRVSVREREREREYEWISVRVHAIARGTIVCAAAALLECCEQDGYVDAGLPASHYGEYLYKVLVPLDPSNNRSVEVTATLLDKDNNVLRTFTLRTHGHRDDGSEQPWPDYGNGDVGLNDISSNGATVRRPC